MEKLIIRLAEPATDFVQLAALLNKVWREPVTAELLHSWESRPIEGQIRRRMVGVAEDGHIIAYSLVLHEPSAAAGDFFLTAIVDPAQRRQGVGQQMYDEALAFALEQGATLLRGEVNEGDEPGMAFARKHGFAIDKHIYSSVIDLHTFDDSHFAGLIEHITATGIRFFSLADVNNEARWQRQLYEVNVQAALDDPASTGTFPDYEEFRQRIFESEWFWPPGQFLAADGDKGVGLAAVRYYSHTNSMYNLITGVLPAYRGRKIAQALKLLTIRLGMAQGADYIRTINDSQNEPMLAVNRKLGYQPRPGEYRLLKQLGNNR